MVKKYTEKQIIAVLREGESGAKVANLCRKYGMSDNTYYNWKAKYAGLYVISGDCCRTRLNLRYMIRLKWAV